MLVKLPNCIVDEIARKDVNHCHEQQDQEAVEGVMTRVVDCMNRSLSELSLFVLKEFHTLPQLCDVKLELGKVVVDFDTQFLL